MAKNKAGGGRIGAVRGRTQFRLPDGHYAKRDRRTGEIIAIKADLKPFKGVVRERENDQVLVAAFAGNELEPVVAEIGVQLPEAA